MTLPVWRPPQGRAGDVIPFVHDDVLHVFYLRTPVGAEAANTTAWYHVSTADLRTWVDHGEAIGRGGPDDQDPSVATGSVVQDDTGLFHAFTTGFSRFDGPDGPRNQAVLHATSTDLLTWVKDPGFLLESDESRYDRHDWRDPFVLRDADGWLMVLAGRHRLPADAPADAVRRSGLVVRLRSTDLRHWAQVTPLWDPGLFTMHECPDVFEHAGWWYLLHSTFDERQVTRYRMARTPDGPWLAPQVVRGHGDDALDDDGLYAARTVDLRGRRLLVGWCPTRTDGRDDGEWQWGGSLVVHEIVPRADGTLGVRLAGPVGPIGAGGAGPASGPASDPAPGPAPVVPGRGRWSPRADGTWDVTAASGSAVAEVALPATVTGVTGVTGVTVTFTPREPTARFGLELRGARESYDLVVDLVRRELTLDRRSRPAWRRPLHTRPLDPPTGGGTVLRAAWQDDVLLVQVGADVVLTARLQDAPPVRLGVFVEDGSGALDVRLADPQTD